MKFNIHIRTKEIYLLIILLLAVGNSSSVQHNPPYNNTCTCCVGSLAKYNSQSQTRNSYLSRRIGRAHLHVLL